MTKREGHEHRPSMLYEETYRTPIVPGTRRKTFHYAVCGGADGCGAIYSRERWFTNPEIEAIYARTPARSAEEGAP